VLTPVTTETGQNDYACAKKYQTELVTADDRFEGLPGVTYFSTKEA
jgi:hypothetical protein